MEEEDKPLLESLKGNVSHYVGSLKQAVSFYSLDNKFIHHGYRINYNTPVLMLKSLFHKHNELINIWTHLIGALLAFFMIIQIILYVDHTKYRVQQDMEQIFNINTQSNGENDSHTISSMLPDLLNKIEQFENQVITSESYKEIVNLLGTVTELVNETQPIAIYTRIIQSKLDSLRNKIIEQIDSQQFDWVEIYKHTYQHATIIRQEETLRKYNDPYHVSRWPIVVFLVSAIFCMIGSAMFHLFFQMSEKANKYLLRVDYGGISLLILGSTCPPFYYGFYCDALPRYFYLFTVGGACLAAYIVSIFDFIHTEKWRRVKGIMYGSLGLFAGIPSIHLYLRQLYPFEGSDYLPFNETFIYYLLMGTSYLGGLAIYILRFPERIKPGWFDFIGHSHQIWHICVFMGVVFSYVAALDNLADRKFTFCTL